MRATNKVALVTGASRGIGAQIALRLAQDGFNVVVNFASSEKEAARVVEEIQALGREALAVKGDVSSSSEVTALFDATEAKFGRLDVLVNNAGVMEAKPLIEHSDALFSRTFAINVQGTFNTLREAGKRLADGGRIINLSTSALGLKMPGYAVYNASKAAVEAFTPVFAKELRGRQITVNAVAPGPVETELFLNGKSEELVAQLANMSPLTRLGQPDDIAAVIAFLASEQGGWINGQVIRANGGIA